MSSIQAKSERFFFNDYSKFLKFIHIVLFYLERTRHLCKRINPSPKRTNQARRLLNFYFNNILSLLSNKTFNFKKAKETSDELDELRKQLDDALEKLKVSTKTERELNEKLNSASDKSRTNETLLENFRNEVQQLRRELGEAKANNEKLSSELK
jgi:chromosome segregation ATPase